MFRTTAAAGDDDNDDDNSDYNNNNDDDADVVVDNLTGPVLGLWSNFTLRVRIKIRSKVRTILRPLFFICTLFLSLYHARMIACTGPLQALFA